MEKNEKTENNVEKIEEKIEVKEEKELKKSNNEKKSSRNKTKKIKWIIISIISVIILLIFSTLFAILNIPNTKIISGISVNGVKIKGLNKEEAILKLEKEFHNEENKIKLQSSDFEYEIDASQIEFKHNINEAVEKAFEYGRNSNIFKNNFDIFFASIFGKNINLEFSYNEELLDKLLDDVATKVPEAVKESDYYIEESELIITVGTEGNSIDKEKVKEAILNKFYNYDDEIINIDLIKAQPKDIDIEKIYEEVHSEPKDAYYTKEPFQVYPHVDGIDFNIDEAKEILKEEKTEYRIPLTITHPNILTKDIGSEAFPDLLGSFTTNYSASNVNRTTNLRLAASKVNGTVVAPGETFSYNKTVGERTISAGYKDAAGYSGGEVVDMLGGGICQISSTLYDAVVYANLEIVSRKNHAFLTSYTTAGRDATVVYGAIDFKFKNNRKYPILIKMSVQNGVAKAEIYGIKEEVEYDIDIQTKVLSYITYQTVYKDDSSLAPGQERVSQGGMNGCKSITYRVRKLNGVEVSSEVLSSDTYNAMNKIVLRGPEKSEPVVAPSIEPAITPTPEPEVIPTPEPEIEEPVPEPETPLVNEI